MRQSPSSRILAGTLGFLVARLVWFLSLSWDGLIAYGDLLHYAYFAALPGWPLLDYWAEYPPLFPWLLEGLYRLTVSQVTFLYALVALFSLAQGLCLGLVWALAAEIFPSQAGRRALTYAALTVGLLYTWGQFDALVVAFTLGGVYLWHRERPVAAGLLVGLGTLSKWFPLLVLPAWLRRRRRAGRKALLAGSALVLAGWALAWHLSPTMARASLWSQSSKGSWETVWALLDGNLRTGLLGPMSDRLDPGKAAMPQGNPPRISPWVTLLPFGALGLWAWRRFHPQKPAQEMAFVGLTWVLFLLWSPGYSPQWVLYLLPWIVLSLPWERAALFGVTLVLVNLAEWPVALSRGLFAALWWLIPLRTLLIALLGMAFWEAANRE